ncbi:cyclic peptide export ABC transporter [Pedobacter sp. WC2423]|uniref:cyclic peptide export ABC transporter n=1 Tax=Pedobacter sp. WC2423 TaxID=3234142 RepID=UPI00346634E7
MKMIYLKSFVSCLLLFLFSGQVYSKNPQLPGNVQNYIDNEVPKLMKKGGIPGLSLIILKDGQYRIMNYGYADVAQNQKVKLGTLFQLGSCSKAFTALAVLKLEREHKLSLNDDISAYISWMHPTYKGKTVNIKISQLLHHTSGISWKTISKIPQSDEPDALQKNILQIADIKLEHLPGKKFEYATINYDVLALIIAKVSGQSFEEYLQKNILDHLDLKNTTIGKPKQFSALAKGYKVGFFEPREYLAPVFKGNNAAGYVISDAEDIARWLMFQMGLVKSDLSDLAKDTQKADEGVAPQNSSFYAMGWERSLNGRNEIYHGGLNPNYTSFIAFRPDQRIGIALLANSNSGYTEMIGHDILDLLGNEPVSKNFQTDDKNDAAYSVICLILVIYMLTLLSYFIYLIIGIRKKEVQFSGFSFHIIKRTGIVLVLLLPALLGIYLLPEALAGFTWKAIYVWSPVSFAYLIGCFLVAIGMSFSLYVFNLFFIENNKYKRIVPSILLMSIISGLSNIIIIILITSSVNSTIDVKYLLFYYFLTMLLYLGGRKYVQLNLIKYANDIIYDLRNQLITKIFSTSFQRFEKLDRGRIYATTSDDVNAIGQASNMLINLFTSLFTAIAAFLYLGSIALWPAVLTALVILIIGGLYNYVVRSTNLYFEKARDAQNVFMSLINGMIDGFKELSLHQYKKEEYKKDVGQSAYVLKTTVSTADKRFVNAFLVGESSLILLLGLIAFAVPKLFPQISNSAVLSFIIILLYLVGPVNNILSSVPSILRLRVSWKRIQTFLAEIPATIELGYKQQQLLEKVESFEVKDLAFSYENKELDSFFSIGPISFQMNSGEILFIVGGNGSGKTTFAKVLTGLYVQDSGEFLINGSKVKNSQLSEYFSAVFNPSFLFEKIYIREVEDKSAQIEHYLDLLQLKDIVSVQDGLYNTIRLSSGQRKRLSLLQCYLEDSPIYLFDEWAADQDPEFRNFFYRTLLPDMRKAGKIIITITHDDRYFDVADRLFKMNNGKLELYDKLRLVE